MINSDVLGEVDTSMDHNKVEPSKVLMSLVIGEFERETQNRSGPNWLNEVFEAAEILLLRKTKLDDQRLLDEFGVIRSRGQSTISVLREAEVGQVIEVVGNLISLGDSSFEIKLTARDCKTQVHHFVFHSIEMIVSSRTQELTKMPPTLFRQLSLILE